jgi:hypothetical protein
MCHKKEDGKGEVLPTKDEIKQKEKFEEDT